MLDEASFIEPDFRELAEHCAIDRSPLLTLAEWRRAGLRCALATIIAIDGRSPRSLGAQMAVNEHGAMQGYLTGGCLERNLVLFAIEAMREGHNRIYRFGNGSPFIDLKLPCGSGIDIYFDQAMDDAVVFAAARHIGARRPFSLRTDLADGVTVIRPLARDEVSAPIAAARDGRFERLVKPPVRLQLFGAGLAAVQLAHLARAAGMDVDFHTVDDVTHAAGAALGLAAKIILPEGFRAPPSDPWTASMLMFHEHEREIPLLMQLVEQPGFYIGAIGSSRVSEQRIRLLREAGVDQTRIDRITMSAGLVRRSRNATEISLGILAEIFDRARADNLVA